MRRRVRRETGGKPKLSHNQEVPDIDLLLMQLEDVARREADQRDKRWEQVQARSQEAGPALASAQEPPLSTFGAKSICAATWRLVSRLARDAGF